MKSHSYFGFSTIGGNQQKTVKAEKKIGPACASSNCKKSKFRHCEQFDNQIRDSIFKMFWSWTWESKRVFVKSMVSQIDVQRSRVQQSNKHNTFKYKLPLNHEPIQVCRSMFLSTLAININTIRECLKDKENIVVSNRQSS